MTDRTQFEAMLEALINEDQETAKEIFHNIVVAKSREIYEELLAEDFDLSEGENPFAKSEEDGDEEKEPEDDGEDDGDEEKEPKDDEDGGDATDDFVSDVSDDGEGSEEGEGEGDVEDRVMDLEDALEELKAEFEQLMADENNEPEHHDGMDDPAFGGDELGGADIGAPEMGDEEPVDELQRFMEYVDKVALPKHGDNGVNTKSIIDNMKNDMGGTTANIAQGFSTEKGGTQGGLAKPSTTVMDGGNINKPGANAGKTAFKKKEPGHGAERKGAPEKADNKQSLLKQAKK
jgi:hypothetical protein